MENFHEVNKQFEQKMALLQSQFTESCQVLSRTMNRDLLEKYDKLEVHVQSIADGKVSLEKHVQLQLIIDNLCNNSELAKQNFEALKEFVNSLAATSLSSPNIQRTQSTSDNMDQENYPVKDLEQINQIIDLVANSSVIKDKIADLETLVDSLANSCVSKEVVSELIQNHIKNNTSELKNLGKQLKDIEIKNVEHEKKCDKLYKFANEIESTNRSTSEINEALQKQLLIFDDMRMEGNTFEKTIKEAIELQTKTLTSNIVRLIHKVLEQRLP